MIGFFSDLHLGVHQDSPVWHQIALDFAKWSSAEFKKRGVEIICIGGDIFHNRHEVGVSTLHAAHKFFHYFKDFELHAIVGNHDARQKHSSLINSIDVLGDWGNKFHVYSVPKRVTISNKRIGMVPWAAETDQLPSCDVILGHFEINNFKMSKQKVCENGIDGGSLLQKAPLILSGHFHIPDDREYDDGRIVYLGSPFELDFGDLGSTKGIYILDKELEFIPNHISPKHKRIYLSELLEGQYELKKEVPGNIVSLCLDQPLDFADIDKLVLKLNGLNPLQLRTEVTNKEVTSYVSSTESISIDIEQAFEQFINSLELSNGINKEDLLNKVLELWKQCQE